MDEHARQRRKGLAQRDDMRSGLTAAAEDAQGRRAGAGKTLRRDRRRRCGSPLTEQVGLDDRLELGALDRDEHDEERRAAGQPGVGLQACEAELAVDAWHDGEDAAGQLGAHARRVVDRAARDTSERFLDRDPRRLG